MTFTEALAAARRADELEKQIASLRDCIIIQSIIGDALRAKEAGDMK